MENVLFLGLSGVVASIRPPSNGTGNSPVEVSNLKALGSYNWVEDQVPTIAIPGGSTTSSYVERTTLAHRIEWRYRKPFFDEDIARKCGYPLEPDLLAIKVSQATDPSFKLSEENIDIVTNRNNLRKLIEFANSGTGNRGQYRSENFRIDAQLAPNGRTMVLTRYEARRSERQSNNRFIGFDHMFERIATEELPSIRATNSGGRTVHLRPVGYHRIVRYDLLGMRFLVRSRVDAMLQGPSNSGYESSAEQDIDGLSKVLEQIKLKLDSVDTSLPILHEEAAGMRYVNFGEFVPQDSLMDIKLAHKHHINWNNVYSQYFLSQTPNLKIADRTTVGRKCFVAQVDTYGKDSLKTEHEKRSQQFRNLVAVLREMRRTLQARGGSSQPLAFVYCQKGNLKAYIIREKGEYLSEEGLETF
ncbi:geranylgeranyl pyrophosphate synthetase [Rhizoctonia solani]|uniref:Geranylgeranyl pyrophosphate synthetase n=1 Tax=Rhizoctonia solani TaxID=456999 RepID=A0A8H8SZ53_9AGAM|nr:geranylgeranyl pyrophosphate synthetase [Rhizoctonia solani]QRW23219.1 geranylgeranyl pyrophosphate synthetase [Rhizoctonia solani]